MRGDRGVEFTFIFNYTQKGCWGYGGFHMIQEVIVVVGVWEYQDGGAPQFDGYMCVINCNCKIGIGTKESQRCRSLILMPKLNDTHTLLDDESIWSHE